MGVVDVPGHEPWFIANYELRLLFERAAEDLTDAEDRATLERAAAFSGLMLEHYDPGRQDRLARALQRAANALAQEVAANPRDVRDRRAALAFESLVRLLAHVPPAGCSVEPIHWIAWAFGVLISALAAAQAAVVTFPA